MSSGNLTQLGVTYSDSTVLGNHAILNLNYLISLTRAVGPQQALLTN